MQQHHSPLWPGTVTGMHPGLPQLCCQCQNQLGPDPPAKSRILQGCPAVSNASCPVISAHRYIRKHNSTIRQIRYSHSETRRSEFQRRQHTWFTAPHDFEIDPNTGLLILCDGLGATYRVSEPVADSVAARCGIAERPTFRKGGDTTLRYQVISEYVCVLHYNITFCMPINCCCKMTGDDCMVCMNPTFRLAVSNAMALDVM